MLPISGKTGDAARSASIKRALVPVAATALASLAPILPLVASQSLVPPFGLMTLIAWRLLRADVWPLWVAIPLGAWDDLVGGLPLGTAVCGWTASLLALDVVDTRLQWRGYRADWMIASVSIAAVLLFSLLITRNAGSTASPLLLAPQIVLSALLFPCVSRLCAALDRWRLQ